MLKKISFILMVIAIIVVITSCGSSSVDIWDGSVATSFVGGDGSAEKPYEISTGAELAYLAAQVNAGNTYDDIHFILTNDIDLNNLEWMPIGNGIYSFGGVFDGEKHTIYHLFLSDVTVYEQIYQSGTPSEVCAVKGILGLFGTCEDAELRNLTIHMATVSVGNANVCDDTISIGVLIGSMTAKSIISISNIRITDVDIRFSSDQDLRGVKVYIGGVVGYLRGTKNSILELQSLSTDLSIDIRSEMSEYRDNTNYHGGIIGFLDHTGKYSCENFSSTLTVMLNSEIGRNHAGAIGYAPAATHEAVQCVFRNGVSFVYVNQPEMTFYNTPEITNHYKNEFYAILGSTYFSDISVTEYTSTGYVFENCFGCVYHTDETTEIRNSRLELFYFPNAVSIISKNCIGCEILPEGHKLDPDIWNFDNSETPDLK